MQKVLMLLFIIMHIVLTTSYFINSGIIFFTTYFWFLFCIITVINGTVYFFAKLPVKEKNTAYKVLASTLILVSMLNLFFILYISFVNPYFYLEFRH
ncbi:hypothetical protein [Macrococcus equipercicus]|uniref:Uncharacterized protein n=1 Tax=Macrococcus equipercicus TaxID=69967 RepID=A0A9Q9BNY2_9STAP|nr:hypothetical protein [Macrococcus equipercicus]KAA1039664.1 hypothetical protein ERX35_006205 [Macrococcus equipercicus]UTH13995.1 hypothetical protein KFV11_01065 [Macrococcus equipercicus]